MWQRIDPQIAIGWGRLLGPESPLAAPEAGSSMRRKARGDSGPSPTPAACLIWPSRGVAGGSLLRWCSHESSHPPRPSRGPRRIWNSCGRVRMWPPRSRGRRRRSTSTSWLPCAVGAGLGSQCHGVWTERWSDPAVLEELKLSLEAPLLLAVEQHQCPFGVALPGDVTWPSPPESLRGIVAPRTPLKVVAVAYSLVPYAVGISASVSFFRRRGTRQLWMLLWAWPMIPLQELVFKRISPEPRPGTMLQVRDYAGMYAGSCLKKCGMPSSHANLTIGWFTLLLLDAIYRVRPFALGRKTQTILIRPGASGAQKYAKCLRLYLTVPWEHRDLLTHTEFLVYISTWILILIPVPFMRVALYDHTFDQVTVGAMIGLSSAVVWWRIARRLQRRYQEHEGCRVFYGLLEHNHKLTQFHLTNSGDIVSEMPEHLGLSPGSAL
ncbi:unnamed protein product [Prorocentrum cordatum]|uniref:Phosphatidic acid phosphatase type 2/haloperoxidase domain-containing protein n=1 Tax=Prorocentrum cordatum TaxID=2364126 RepID=A0ABN9XYS3_9DINO|nr:unnamed protein product [Polarella glacialis]